MWTTLGWDSWAASRASPRNILTKSGESARWGRMRLTATRRSKPSSPRCWARNTSAIPPRARRRSSMYWPNLIPPSGNCPYCTGVTASLLLAMAAAMTAGCTDAIELSITSDRGSGELDAVCVGVADTSLRGGHFGRDYELAKVGALPQTLRVDAGGAASAWSWVRGDRGGVPTARATAPIDFDGGVTLALPACVTGHAGEPAQVGDPVGPAAARLVASQGQGGALVVALGAGSAAVIAADDGALVARAAPALTGTVVDAVAIDV